MPNLIKTEKIVSFMKRNKLTSHEFCLMCDIEDCELESVMNNLMVFKVSTLFKIGKTIGVEVKDLVNLTKK